MSPSSGDLWWFRVRDSMTGSGDMHVIQQLKFSLKFVGTEIPDSIYTSLFICEEKGETGPSSFPWFFFWVLIILDMKQLVRQEYTKLIICYQMEFLQFQQQKWSWNLCKSLVLGPFFFSKISTFIQMNCFLQLGKASWIYQKQRGSVRFSESRIKQSTCRKYPKPRLLLTTQKCRVMCNMIVSCKHTSTGRKFALVEGLSHDLVCAGSNYHVHFAWQVWHGQYSPGFKFNKLKKLFPGGNWPESCWLHVDLKGSRGKGFCSRTTQEA